MRWKQENRKAEKLEIKTAPRSVEHFLLSCFPNFLLSCFPVFALSDILKTTMCHRLAIILAALISIAVAASAAAAGLLVAGDAQNLWVVRTNPHGEFVVLHRSPGAADDTLYRVLKATGHPQAIAACDNTLYCIYSDLSVQALRFISSESYLPTLRAQQLAPLEETGQLIGFVAGRDGPIALLKRATQGNEALATKNVNTLESEVGGKEKEEGGQDMADEAPTVESPEPTAQPLAPFALFKLRMGRWEPMPVPTDLSPDHFMQLVMISPTRDRLAILSETRPPSGLTVHNFDGQSWSRDRYLLKLSPLSQGVGIEDDLAIVAPLAGAESRQFNLFYLRQGSVAPRGTVKPITPGAPWAATCFDNRITIVLNDPDQPLRWAQYSITDAARQSEPRELAEAAPSTMPDPRTLVFLVAVIIGMLFLFATARREPGASVPRLPPDLHTVGPGRAIAATIDLVPAILIAMIVFKLRNPADLFANWPGTTTEWKQVLPAALAITIYVTHTSVCELLFAASLGKAIMGLRVVNLLGEPPHIWQVLARNVFKAVELIAPLLLVLPLLSEHHQRLGDLVARTLVVGRIRHFLDDD